MNQLGTVSDVELPKIAPLTQTYMMIAPHDDTRERNLHGGAKYKFTGIPTATDRCSTESVSIVVPDHHTKNKPKLIIDRGHIRTSGEKMSTFIAVSPNLKTTAGTLHFQRHHNTRFGHGDHTAETVYQKLCAYNNIQHNRAHQSVLLLQHARYM